MMKKKISGLSAFIVMFLLASALVITACSNPSSSDGGGGGDGGGGDVFTSATNETISNDVTALGLTGTSVSSSNPGVAIAAIISGKIRITSVSQGSALITISNGSGHSATIAVTVSATGAITIGTITKYVDVGSGDTGDWIAINNADELHAVRNNLSGKYYLAATFSLADPAYSTGEGWQPIGSYSAPFTGVIEGRGHSIKDLKINNTNNAYENIYGSYIGLFGYVKAAEITDLILEDVNITVTVPSDGYITRYTGAIAGYAANDSVLSGCSCTGTLSISSPSATLYTGGIVGRADNSNIKDCINTMSNLDSVSSSVNTTYTYTGGIAGYVNIGNVSGSSSTGTINGSGGTIAYVGGITGNLGGNGSGIIGCYSTGNISASPGYTGGITAWANGGYPLTTTIKDCHSTGEINADYSGGALAGGIAAIATGYSSYPIIISGCYSTGSVKSTASTNNGSVTPNPIAGGITARLSNGKISTCYSSGNIIVTSVQQANNPANGYGGGITGYLMADTSPPSVITDSYSRGNISVTVTTNIAGTSGTSYAGGIAGFIQNGSINACYTRGSVHATSNSPVPYSYAGGIAGRITTSSGTSEISACAVISPVINSKVTPDTNNSFVGRIGGNERNPANTTVNNNFALDYDDDFYLHIIGNTLTAHSTTLKTTDELKIETTYSNPIASGGLGWNFGSSSDNPWKMSADYPVLYYQ